MDVIESDAGLMRDADLLLCPMFSPQTSYPVLEMAARRGIAVTNAFGSKTRERLSSLSPQIVTGAASVEALTQRYWRQGHALRMRWREVVQSS